VQRREVAAAVKEAKEQKANAESSEREVWTPR
jgi:hypothetical protein